MKKEYVFMALAIPVGFYALRVFEEILINLVPAADPGAVGDMLVSPRGSSEGGEA